jgi:hypothetical protein
MPLYPEPPDLQVLQPLPPLGTALPVVIDSAAMPLTGLPEVGQWIKLRVVGLRLVQVRCWATEVTSGGPCTIGTYC